MIDIRSNTTQQYTGEDISNALNELYRMAWGMGAGPESGKKIWESIWMKDFPVVKTAAVAPVQPKKESKVQPSKKEEKKSPNISPKSPEKKEAQGKKEYIKPEIIEEPPVEEEKSLKEQITEEETDDRYEYYEPETTIEGLVELLMDYEVAVEKEEKQTGKNPMYVSVDIDEGFAASIYNAIKELQYMQKIGGHRR